MSHFGRAGAGRRHRPAGALVGIAAAGVTVALTMGTAHAAVPAYQSFEIPAPQVQAGSFFGERVRAIGDINDDGVRDVLMSSSGYDGDDGSGTTLPNSGRVYIFSGRTRALLRTIEPPNPQAQAKFGFWDASLGDIDGDGAGDFAISAASQVIGGATLGQVYIYSGRSATRLRTINPPESLAPTGSFGGDFGGNLIAPGDLDGDGATDIVATSSGAFGSVGAAYAFSSRTGALIYKVANPSTQASSFGFGAAELGDVNRDGVNDFQVGAPRFNEGAVVGVGRSYVINGRTGAVLYTLLNPEPEANDRFGQADADGISVGDVNGDGAPDIFVDSFLGNDSLPGGPSLDNAGKAFLFSGATGEKLSTLHDPNPQGGRNFGASNADAGDIDGDGRSEALISSRGGTGSTSVGSVTVFGGDNLSKIVTTFEAPSTQGGAFFGTGLASPGDVNGDGAPDYFISARGQDVPGAVDAGMAWAFLSQVPRPPSTMTGPPPPPNVVHSPPVGVLAPIAARDRTRPKLKITGIPKSISRAKLLTSGLKVTVSSNEPARLTGMLQATARRASVARYELALTSRSLALGTGKRTFKLRPSARLFGRPGKTVTLRLRVEARDVAGNRTIVVRTFKVRRR